MGRLLRRSGETPQPRTNRKPRTSGARIGRSARGCQRGDDRARCGAPPARLAARAAGDFPHARLGSTDASAEPAVAWKGQLDRCALVPAARRIDRRRRHFVAEGAEAGARGGLAARGGAAAAARPRLAALPWPRPSQPRRSPPDGVRGAPFAGARWPGRRLVVVAVARPFLCDANSATLRSMAAPSPELDELSRRLDALRGSL